MSIYIISKELFVLEVGIMRFMLFIGCWLYNMIFNKGINLDENLLLFVSFIVLLILSGIKIISMGFTFLLFFIGFSFNSIIKR